MKNQDTPVIDYNRLEAELATLESEVLKERDRIIPIIGDDCFVGEINGDHIPLCQWIAEKVLQNNSSPEIKQKVYSDGYKGLDLLFEEYKSVKNVNYANNSVFKQFVKGIITRNMSSLSLRPDVKNFLVAGRFEVIVTTCPFPILQKEGLRLGDKEYKTKSFAPNSIGPRAEATLQLPAIYQIFGDCTNKDNNDFVFGEEELLEFLHHLNQSGVEKGFGASPLVKYIRDKNSNEGKMALFMPIGCSNLPDWIFRFLWYPLSPFHEGGIWPNYRDQDFYSFLSKYKFSTFSIPTNALQENNTKGDPVLNRLTKAFQERGISIKEISEYFGVTWNNEGEWDIFISYASDDVEIAQKVYDVLTGCGKKVWMDRRGNINVSDNYWSVIQYGIEHSSKVLFIITNAYLRRAIVRKYIGENGVRVASGVYEEIDRIRRYFLDKEMDRKKGGYVIPLIIEGTTVTYTDDEGDIQKNVQLDGGLLEKLYERTEYQMLQTKGLFEHIQCMKSSQNTIGADLRGII